MTDAVLAGVLGVEAVDWTGRVDDELRDRLFSIWDDLDQELAEQNRRYSGGGRDVAPRLDPDDLQQILAALEQGRPAGLGPHNHAYDLNLGWKLEESAADLPLVVLTALLARAGLLLSHIDGLTNVATRLFERRFTTYGKPTLLEIAVVLDGYGLDGSKLLVDRYRRNFAEIGRHWPDDAVAPFVLHALPEFLALLSTASKDWYSDDDAPYRALATLPVLPDQAVDALFAIALGSRKTGRRKAQDVLAEVDGFEERIAPALADSKAESRASAAAWLQRLRYEPALPALERAVVKEKNETVKGALLDALEAYGRPVAAYIDRDGLAKQAEAGLAKALPKGLEWLHWESLPTVHWADTGERVPVPVLQWLIVQAVKAKSPEPNALLRKYCGMFADAEREEFGQYLLESWLAADTMPISTAEAARIAEKEASNYLHWMQMYPQNYASTAMHGMTKDQLVQHLLPEISARTGSANSSKGLLAVAAACAGERAAAPVQQYLKQYYGTRAAQGKALIGMLAWIEHPSATQLMLSVGSRFRTKSFQEEATRQANALAERKGWTLGELADRTIPVAGFEDDGRIELSYGERVFTAVLRPDLTVELRSPDGKKLKALPAARQSDDEDAVKAAKKALSTTKKELKAIVQLQTARLYEALCTERTWSFADWRQYLNEHPVARYLTQRLAWVADGKTVFRPLDDGTLTDVDDNAVELADDAVIAVAHDSLLDEETVRSWQEHLDDYEVVPLFQQFGKGSYRLPFDCAERTAMEDFKGHLLEAFALRGRTGKLGYTRGQTEDAGWFYNYEKRFPTLGITVDVHFTGNPLPEENRTVALTTLSFFQQAPPGSGLQSVRMRLADVPAVLLSEAYNDVRLMAGDGTGYASDWEKRSEY